MSKINSVEFRIIVRYTEGGEGTVSIQHSFGEKEGIEAPFDFWMLACEYLLHKTAQKSKAGYEKALELLCKGAMTYKDLPQETNE